MIEKMKMVHVVSTVSAKQKMLGELRDLSLLHIAEKKSADHQSIERFTKLSQMASRLVDYRPDKKDKKNAAAQASVPVLSDADFEKLFEDTQKALARRDEISQEISRLSGDLEKIRDWGDFSPKDVQDLRAQGYDLHFYRLEKKAYEEVAADPNIKAVHLKSVDKMETVAVLGRLPEQYKTSEFVLPEKGVSELNAEIESLKKEDAECTKVLQNAALYEESFNAQMLKAQNEEVLSSAGETAQNDNDLVWISGYIPESGLEQFKKAAADNKWAWAMEDISDEDDQVPTSMKYGKVSKLIKPLFDILGILPGYREQDVSLWILLFFTLFFAMIFGDAGYGCIILIGTIIFHVKTKKPSTAIFLLYVLSAATIVWGAVTGTWFGMESAMKVPLLKALVIPNFANYPEYFGVTATAQQNTIMKFSFSIGAIQMALGSILSIKKKIPEKNLSWVADLGWTIAVIAMYLLSLYLVIGEKINITPIFAMIGVAFVLVVLFGGMSPDKTIGQGIKAGLADAFTVFLNTISCFGNVMSYIRLFAVGMAGLAISQSFNGLASGFKGPLLIVGVVIVIIGHVLNIVMCLLSVVVHGVRLNVLEFSGQVGLEWTGIPYEPFKVNDKIKN